GGGCGGASGAGRWGLPRPFSWLTGVSVADFGSSSFCCSESFVSEPLDTSASDVIDDFHSPMSVQTALAQSAVDIVSDPLSFSFDATTPMTIAPRPMTIPALTHLFLTPPLV